MRLNTRPDTRKVFSLLGCLATKDIDTKSQRIFTKYLRDWYNNSNIFASYEYSSWPGKLGEMTVTVQVDDSNVKEGYRILEQIKQDFEDIPLDPNWIQHKWYNHSKPLPTHHNFLVNDLNLKEVFLWLRENVPSNEYQFTSLYSDDITIILSDPNQAMQFKLRFDR